MRGQTIGKKMPHGYAGGYARQPDMIVDTHPLEGSDPVKFGSPVVYGTAGAVKLFGEAGTAEAFLGVAVREVKSATDYFNQNEGDYHPGEAVPVMKRGCVNVVCQSGTPGPGGKVFVRIKANSAKPKALVGGFEATEDKSDTVTYTALLTNAQWKGSADANGVAELCILTRNNA